MGERNRLGKCVCCGAAGGTPEEGPSIHVWWASSRGAAGLTTAASRTHRWAKKTPRLRKGWAGHPVSRCIRSTSAASMVWQPNCGGEVAEAAAGSRRGRGVAGAAACAWHTGGGHWLHWLAAPPAPPACCSRSCRQRRLSRPRASPPAEQQRAGRQAWRQAAAGGGGPAAIERAALLTGWRSCVRHACALAPALRPLASSNMWACTGRTCSPSACCCASGCSPGAAPFCCCCSAVILLDGPGLAGLAGARAALGDWCYSSRAQCTSRGRRWLPAPACNIGFQHPEWYGHALMGCVEAAETDQRGL